MANVIDVIINASWRGGSAVKGASTDLRGLSNAAAQTSVEMAAGQQRAILLDQALTSVGQQVALGTLTVEQGVEAYQQYETSLADVGTQAPKTGINIAALTSKVFLAAAAFTAITLAAKKGIDAIKSGAQLELTIQRFDRLAESIGTTGDALLGDIGIATQGLISDMDAAASATDFLALGLVQTHDEAVRLSAVAAQLGFDMNQLVLTIANQTTLRFDALGVAVIGFAEKVDRLEEAGHDANEAFKLAFLEQAEEQIERLGSVAETTAGKISLIESAWKNTLVEFQRSSVEGLGPVISLLASGIVAANEAEVAVKEFSDAAGELGDQRAAVQSLNDALQELEGRGQFGLLPLQTGATGLQAFIDVTAEAASAGDTLEEQQRILTELGFEIDGNRIKLDDYSVAWEAVGEAIEAVQLGQLIEKTGRVHREMQGFIDSFADVEDNTEEMEKLAEAVEKLDLRELLKTAGLTSEEFTRMSLAMDGSANALQHIQDNIDTFEAAAQLDKVLEGLDERIAERLEDRADLFVDFQSEITDIAFREAERRSDVEASSEERRTEIVERHGERRARDEEDWARSRLRQAQKLQRDIGGVNEDTADRAIELREDTDQRLEELERDHLGRIADIIRDADLALEDAASRLDAAAIVSIQRQRKAALQDERDEYADQRDEIGRELQQRLEEERDAAQERIAEMQAFHAERQRIEAEDRQIRLDRQAQDHEAQLAALDAQHAQRLSQIMLDAAAERMVRENQYGIDRTQLVDNLQNRADDHQKWMDDILEEESAWWEARMDLIPDTASAGGDIPLHLLQNAAPTVPATTTNIAAGAITIPVTAADGQSPAAVAENVAEVLEGIFERFQ